MKITIIGTGVFGSFLQTKLAPYCEIEDNADIVILAVPFDAYEEVTAKYADKHLVNVCSVQEQPNNICLKYSNRVTGIHPLFGPTTALLHDTEKYSLVTLQTDESQLVLNLFANISQLVYDNNGVPLDGKSHDLIMSLTHLQVVKIASEYASIIEITKNISDNCLPASFRQLKQVLQTVNSMSDGTKHSILSNK
jgi:prephenate dehydrogenase